MPKETETGNPVFDYRADYRKSAEKLQYYLIFGGFFLFVVCGIAFFFARITEHLRVIAGLASLGGIVLLVSGIAWAFFWRNRIRDEFQDKFGMK